MAVCARLSVGADSSKRNPSPRVKYAFARVGPHAASTTEDFGDRTFISREQPWIADSARAPKRIVNDASIHNIAVEIGLVGVRSTSWMIVRYSTKSSIADTPFNRPKPLCL